MLDYIRLSLQWPQQPRQFAAVAFAHLRITEHEWIRGKLRKRYFFASEQWMPCWHRHDQRVMPYRLCKGLLADLRSMGKPDREIACSQSTQLL